MTAPKPLPRTDYPTDRAALAAGYRHLADLIESGRAPLPVNASVTLNVDYGDWQHPDDEQPAAARDLMRALGGGTYRKAEYGSDLILRGMCAGLPIDVWASRNAVCERVVVGKREIHTEVPIGEDTRPVKTVTRTEDVVEWRCAPLLGAATESADAVEVPA